MKSENGFSDLAFVIILAIILITFIGFIFYCITVEYQNEETIEITVKDKYIKRSGKTDLYLIASEEGETYKISDLFFKSKFNSTDLYNQLEIGKKYKVEVTGIRNQFLSMYKNINKIEEIEKSQKEKNNGKS